MSAVAGAAAVARPGRVRRTTQRKLDTLLGAAAELIAEQGFEATAIRDVGRKVGASLAGMYYYFASKEDLLFQIQYRTFASLLEAQERIAGQPGGARERIRRLLVGHLAFFARHPHEMKVCTKELESLSGEYYRRTESLRRRYYHLMADAVAELMNGTGGKARESSRSRHATLFIFGILNWVFMWYDPARDGPVGALGDEIFDFVLNGLRPGASKR
jgi:AcrR family transcriptional regulator